MQLAKLLNSIVREGTLRIIDAYGKEHCVGDRQAGFPLVLRLHHPSLHWKLLVNPQLALGEAYMDGTLTVENGDIAELLGLMMRNIGLSNGHPFFFYTNLLRRLGRRLAQYNPVNRSRRNVAHHYDLSTALFEKFLDPDLQYSCAYFTDPGQSLEDAQDAKKRHIAAKLLLRPNAHVLDIGSGWGGLALSLARLGAGSVTGITLSQEQLKYAQDRIDRAQPDSSVQFHLKDYREMEGQFDRIVSVGMFEHVGVNHYRRFFKAIYDLLHRDGIALIHFIGRTDGPGVTNPWIAKYIFPGGYTPSLSEVMPAIEKSGLLTTDVEVLRLHYAETLRHWRQRVREQWQEIADLYDERFCRMWEYYLAGSEMGFRHAGLVVFQIQMTKRIDAIPLTRDYILDQERTYELKPAVKRRRPSAGEAA